MAFSLFGGKRSKSDKMVKEAKKLLAKEQYEEAIALLQSAAEQDSSEAAYLLGTMYMDGTHVEKDLKAGLTYFLQAAEGGYGEAFRWAGVAYATGIACESDTQKSLSWYEKSYQYKETSEAAVGLAAANASLGELETAEKWAIRSKELGNPAADDLLQQLEIMKMIKSTK